MSFLKPRWKDIELIGSIIKDPSGIVDSSSISVVYDDTNRLLGVNTSSYYVIYVRGKKRIIRRSLSVQWDNSEGVHYFYINNRGILVSTQDNDEWIGVIGGDGASICSIYWDADNQLSIFRANELHGLMDVTLHSYLHRTRGAIVYDGGDIGDFVFGNGTLSSHAQFSFTESSMADEDIIHINPSVESTEGIPVYYLVGSNWRRKNPDGYCFVYSGDDSGYVGANGRLAYNNPDNGTFVQIGNANFILTHILASNSGTYIAIHGQAEYTTLALARAGASTEINRLDGLDTLFGRELSPIGTILLQSAAYSNGVNARCVQTETGQNYVDWRSRSFNRGNI